MRLEGKTLLHVRTWLCQVRFWLGLMWKRILYRSSL